MLSGKSVHSASSTLRIHLRRLHLLIENRGIINGKLVEAISKNTFPVYNPTTGKAIGCVPDMDIQDLEQGIDAAQTAFSTWSNLEAKQRGNFLKKWHQILCENASGLAEIMTAEAGKPQQEALGEVAYGNSFVEFYSEEARRIHGEIIPSALKTKKLFVERQPLGVAGLITPWNFPHAMIARKASAALAAGCTCVIKPAEDTPFTALAMVKLAYDAGLPSGVLNVITSDRSNASNIGKLLCTSPKVPVISFTGSTQVGRILYSQCSAGIKRIALELGGNAPFIVYESANIDQAVQGAIASKFRNCGQACVASNIFLIQDTIYDKFIEKLRIKVQSIQLGQQSSACVEKGTLTLGPLINSGQLEKVKSFVQDAVRKGAKILIGGKPAEQVGPLYFQPTIITDINNQMALYKDEVFGPVISIMRFKTEEESLTIANESDKGLAGYFYSQNVSQIFRVSRALEVGMCGVNEGIISTPEAPFGGVKASGIGREGSHHGIDEFTCINCSHLTRRKSLKLSFSKSEESINQDPIIESANGHNNNESFTESNGSDEEIKDSSASNSISSFEGDTIANADLMSTALNLEKLYSEILHETLHNVGCKTSLDVGVTNLYNYAQEAFKINNEKHDELLTEAECREAPEILLNVEIVEAKDLCAHDSNGLNDPFVTLYLESNSMHRFNTSVKTATLRPCWEEHFALPIANPCAEDTLCLEVWDFDPAETVKEKLKKIFNVKGVKGVRKFVKEVALAAATGQHHNELIGVARVPLQTIPTSGLTMWYTLEKKHKSHSQGVVKVRVSFGSEKNKQVALQEHRHLLHIILLHELETSKVAPFWWCGTFSPAAEVILSQHTIHSGLAAFEVALSEYCTYVSIHLKHPLDFNLFCALLDKLVKSMAHFEEVHLRLFWDATQKLLPSCLSIIRKITSAIPKDHVVDRKYVDVVEILDKLTRLDLPNAEFHLFPVEYYSWADFGQIFTLPDALKTTVLQRATSLFENYISDAKKQAIDSKHKQIEYLLYVIDLVRMDVEIAQKYYDKLFEKISKFNYSGHLYTYYQERVCSLVVEGVLKAGANLKPVPFEKHLIENGLSTDAFLMEGTLLFEVYSDLQGLCQIGSCYFDDFVPVEFPIREHHVWFHSCVTHWLNIAAFKAMQRIGKAIKLDKLVTITSNCRQSSSAVDTITIFHQVKTFWQKLNWPDIEGSYTFMAKMIDDLCRCSNFYNDQMTVKINTLPTAKTVYNDDKFNVTTEWCFAINNIDHVSRSLKPFAYDLGIDELIEQMKDVRSPTEAERCKQTFENVISNAIDTADNCIFNLLENVIGKMVPWMRRLLIEGAEVINQENNTLDRLMLYVDTNLNTLYDHLDETNFNRVLIIVWETLERILNDILTMNIEKRRPPSFFANLHKTLHLMMGSFTVPTNSGNLNTLKQVERLLLLNGLETSDLIHQVYLELYEQAKDCKESPYGMLTVKAKFDTSGNLHISVLNARNLIAMDSNGYSDPFVRIQLLPEHSFHNVIKPKTQTQYKTLFPLFDEDFMVPLNGDEYRHVKDGLIMFSVKDRDLLSYKKRVMGEAFLHFNDVCSTETDMNGIEQSHLSLVRPTLSGINKEILHILQQRQGDKQAKEFVKRLKQKMT